MLPGLFLIRLKDVYATVIDHDVPVDVTDVQEPIRYKDSPDHSKNIDIMRAMRDDGSGEYDWVYCVKRGAKAPSTASARPDLSKSPKCCEMMGRLVQVMHYKDSDIRKWTDLFGERAATLTAKECYIMRQLAIWYIVDHYMDSPEEDGALRKDLQAIGVDPDSVFRGLNIYRLDNSPDYKLGYLVNGGMRMTDTIFTMEPDPYYGVVSVFTPVISGADHLDYDMSKNKYVAQLTVNVKEENTSVMGGTFRFTHIEGCTVYYNSPQGTKTANLQDEYPSGTPFWLEAAYLDMPVNKAGKKYIDIQVEATSRKGNDAKVCEYDFFCDPSDPSHQSFIGYTTSHRNRFEKSGITLTGQTTNYQFIKKTKYENAEPENEAGAEFDIWNSSLAASFEDAVKKGIGWHLKSSDDGAVFLQNIPYGTYTILQTKAPEGTQFMSPNPRNIVLDPNTGDIGLNALSQNVIFDDGVEGFFDLYKKKLSGYDEYAGTPVSELPPEPNAVFQVWDMTFSSYSKAPADRRDLLTTDAKGYARSKYLPFGTYKVHQIESSSTGDSYICPDFTVKISKRNLTHSAYTATLTNRLYELKIQIRKVDSLTREVIPVSGVEFQVLDSNKKILKDWDGNSTFKTGKDGTCNLSKLGLSVGTYYLKEISAPKGYVLSKDLISFEAKKGEKFVGVGPEGNLKPVDFVDKPVTVSLTLSKEAPMLTGKKETSTGYKDQKGVAFVYSSLPLAGARYEFYCDSNVMGFPMDISLYDSKRYPDVEFSSDGKKFTPYRRVDTNGDGKEDTSLKVGAYLGTYTTDANGQIKLSHLYLDAGSGKATYKALEVSAPAGYLVNSDPVYFLLSDTRSSQSATSVAKSVLAKDSRQTAVLTVGKVGRLTQYNYAQKKTVSIDKPLAGAIIGLYNQEDIYAYKMDGSKLKKELLLPAHSLIEVMTTGGNGSCQTKADLPLGYTYYFRELEAPSGYEKDEHSYPLSVSSKEGSKEAELTFRLKDAIVNHPYVASLQLQLQKTGEMLDSVSPSDTGSEDTKGIAFHYARKSLKDAKYRFYCGMDILGLPMSMDLYDKDLYPYVIKSEDGKTFTPYKMLDTDRDGAPDTPLRKGEKLGLYTTDKNGRITVDSLPLDDSTGKAVYQAIEVEAPKGFILDTEPVIFEVSSSAASSGSQMITRAKKATNQKQNAMIQFNKVIGNYEWDEKNNNYIYVEKPLSGAVFGIYNKEAILHPISGAVLVPEGTLIEAVTSDQDGKCATSCDLPLGYTYLLRELKAPEGIVPSDQVIEIPAFCKDGDTKTITYTFTPDHPVVNTYEKEKPVSLTLKLSKTGEMLSGVHSYDTGYETLQGTEFIYSQLPLAGAQFEFICASDILDEPMPIGEYDASKYPFVWFSPDRKTFCPYKLYDSDHDGKGDLPLKKNTSLGLFHTNENGLIVVKGLSLDARTLQARFLAKEISAPQGFLLLSEPVVFDIKDATHPFKEVIVSEKNVQNENQSAVFRLSKVCNEYVWNEERQFYESVGRPLEGAVFGLFASEDIYGYSLSEGKLNKNKMVSKDTLIEILISGKDGGAMTRSRLPLGYHFYLKELKAPEGYIPDSTIYSIASVGDKDDHSTRIFSYSLAEPILNKRLKDQPVAITLELLKKGEVLQGLGKSLDAIVTSASDRLNYTTVPLEGAEFELYCESDVLDLPLDMASYDRKLYPECLFSSDGKTFMPYKSFDRDGDGHGDIFLKKGALLGTFRTGADGKLRVTGLSLDAILRKASYKAVEISAPYGFQISAEPYFFHVSDARTDYSKKEIVQSGRLTDYAQTAVLSFQKIGKDYIWNKEKNAFVPVEHPLSGAVFGLYAMEEIYSYTIKDGKVKKEAVIPKDSLIETITTDADGKGISSARLPLGSKYYIREIQAPEGYEKNDTTFVFDTHIDSPDPKKAVFEFELKEPIVNELSRGRVRVLKLAADTELPLKNVEFELLTENGDLIEKLVTDADGRAVTETAFPASSRLILRETKTDARYSLGAEEELTLHFSRMYQEKDLLHEITVYNYPKAEIRVVKVTGDGNATPMDGVTFELWLRNESGEDTLVETGITGSDGSLSFFVGEGEYYLIEKDLGKWTRFTLLPDPAPVLVDKEDTIVHVKLEDKPTHIRPEKRSAATGGLLGNCGLIVRDVSGRTCSFKWVEAVSGYLYCDEKEEGALQVLLTNNNAQSPSFGKIDILGLPQGEYEITEVQAPEGYRNDHQVLKVKLDEKGNIHILRFYDSIKTGENRTLLGIGICTVFGVMFLTFSAISIYGYADYFAKKRRNMYNR